MIPFLLPSKIPASGVLAPPPIVPSADPWSPHNIAIGGVLLNYANDEDHPNIRETIPPEKDRIDSAASAGEQTLSSWWIRAQDSFHGGAGQLNLETEFPAPLDHVRFALSKNVDVWTPGQVTRLPDTQVASAVEPTAMVAVVLADGSDAIVYVVDGAASILTALDDVPDTEDFSGVDDPILALATDGTAVYAATGTDVIKLDPGDVSAATTLASLSDAATDCVLGWVKSRLMLGAAGAVYEIDVSQTAVTLGSTELRYQHPATGFHWRCFSTSPTAVLAAGDAGGVSTITQFTIVNVDSVPELQVTGDIAELPVGERVLSMLGVQASFQAIGTTKGVRIGTFDTYIGTLNLGPLELQASDPTIPCVALGARDRFVFAAGLAYDEGGLIRLDLGSQIDPAGRFAWAPDLIAPAATTQAATGLVQLSDARLVFAIPGTGICVEQDGPGVGRESWLLTSRIRWNTTEPKLYKLGRIRGVFTSGAARVAATTPDGTFPLAVVGLTTSNPPEFRLVPGPAEWLQLTVTLTGDVSFGSYQVKALPGTRRQYNYQLVVAIYDNVTTQNGIEVMDALSARGKFEMLKAYDQAADEVILQEFLPTGTLSTRVTIDRITMTETARPTTTSDFGGIATILLKTVES